MNSSKFVLGEKSISIRNIFTFMDEQPYVEVGADAIERVQLCRTFLEQELKAEKVIYGVNTGFGRLASTRISRDDSAKLQVNLIRSHCAGVGEPLEPEAVRLVMFLVVHCLLRGHSGVRPALIEYLVNLLNLDFRPIIPLTGSLGASGDLAPLASLALALIGEGKVLVRGKPFSSPEKTSSWKVVPASEALNTFGLSPFQLREKEGLALINQTAVTQAVLLQSLRSFCELFPALIVAVALSHEAFSASNSHFSHLLYELKPQEFTLDIARILRILRAADTIKANGFCSGKIQDPYSFRAVVHVMASLASAFSQLAQAVQIEVNSCTDNPLVFADSAKVVSGANFHAERLAQTAEACCLAIARSAMMSERRVNQLLHPSLGSGLPPFLAKNSGLESGFMLLQYVDCALVGELVHLAHPANLINIPVSGDQEDFVSFSLASATKLKEAMDKFARVISIELITSAKAIRLKRTADEHAFAGFAGSPALKLAMQKLLEVVDIPEEDLPMSESIEKLSQSLREGLLGRSFFELAEVDLSPVFPWLQG